MKPYPVYLVGGAVRDYLMGNIPKDYDFCTPATPDEIEEKIHAFPNDHGDPTKVYGIGKRFGTLGCKVGSEMVEITTFRAEKYSPGNRKPEVTYVKSITEDLSRRDFTINAMAIRITKGHIRIIDPFEGQEDLERRLIRAVGSPKQRFKEDPLRILRAVRFACRYNFEIEQATYKKMQSGAINILNISKERWMMELDKILQSDFVERGLMDLWQSNLFRYMIPELELQNGYDQNSEYHDWNLDVHTINVVNAVRKDTDNLNMLWAALLHDSMKPFLRTENTKGYSNYIGHEVLGASLVDKYAKYLNWSEERHKVVRDLVLNHLNDDSPLRKYDNMCKLNK